MGVISRNYRDRPLVLIPSNDGAEQSKSDLEIIPTKMGYSSSEYLRTKYDENERRLFETEVHLAAVLARSKLTIAWQRAYIACAIDALFDNETLEMVQMVKFNTETETLEIDIHNDEKVVGKDQAANFHLPTLLKTPSENPNNEELLTRYNELFKDQAANSIYLTPWLIKGDQMPMDKRAGGLLLTLDSKATLARIREYPHHQPVKKYELQEGHPVGVIDEKGNVIGYIQYKIGGCTPHNHVQELKEEARTTKQE